MPQFRSNHNRFTVYDAMEAAGKFASNPANIQSFDSEGVPLYKGPIQYPKMLYHPQGLERITKEAEILTTTQGVPLTFPDGTYRTAGEQKELIFEIAHNAKEERELRSKGWHDNPADAIFARTGVRPATSPALRIGDLEAEVARLQARIAAMQTGKDAPALREEDDEPPDDLGLAVPVPA